MVWQKFEELKSEYPEAIIEKKIKGFEIATENLANLAVVKLTDVRSFTSEVEGDFKYELILFSNVLKNYQFRILSFGYGITLSPIYISLEDVFYEEIYDKKRMEFGEKIKVKNTDELEKLIAEIFNTESFKLVVRGLMKVAKKNL